MPHQVVQHATDAGAEGHRKVFGVTGNNYLFLVFGALLTLLLLHLAMNTGMFAGWSMLTRLVVALLPAAASLLYVYGFLEGREPYYQEDVIEGWVNGADMNVVPRRAWTRHPLRGGGFTRKRVSRLRRLLTR
jgi:hypothetical protein